MPPPLSLDNQGSVNLVVATIVLTVIATFSVVGRFISRRICKAGYSWDDWLVVAALAALYGHISLTFVAVFNGGIGRHMGDVQPRNVIMLAKNSTYITVAALDIAGDLAIVVLPMRMIWHLHVSTLSKIGLSYLFGLGHVSVSFSRPSATRVLTTPDSVVLAAILRIKFLSDLNLGPGADFTYEACRIWLWSVIEPSLAIIVACGAVLKPLFKKASAWLRNTLCKSDSRDDPFHCNLHDGRGPRRRSRLIGGNSSDSEIPLHGREDGFSRKYWRSSTRAEGAIDPETGLGLQGGRGKADSVLMQRDISVQLSDREEPATR
ncbi:MAG: hypothetical protein Q9162_005052 [Coniocarpon cinnabarinum]